MPKSARRTNRLGLLGGCLFGGCAASGAVAVACLLDVLPVAKISQFVTESKGEQHVATPRLELFGVLLL